MLLPFGGLVPQQDIGKESAPWVHTSETHALLILDKRRQHSAKGTKTRDARGRSRKVCHDPGNAGRDTDPATSVGKDIEPHCCRWRVELVVTRMVDAKMERWVDCCLGCWTYLSLPPPAMDGTEACREEIFAHRDMADIPA